MTSMAGTEDSTAGARAGAPDGQPAAWRDGKRYAWLLGVVVPTLPFIVYGLVHLTGLWLFWFWGPILIFGVFPPLDLLIGLDSENPPDSVLKWLEQDRYYRWCTYAFLPLQYAGLVFACWLWASGDLTVVDKVGLALTEAMVSGIAINTAHELGHKRDSLERWLSKIALAQSGYGHFFVEHNRGHHVRVATPEDPASARLGESFWAFLPRTVKGSLVSAWELEREWLDRHDRHVVEHPQQRAQRLGDDLGAVRRADRRVRARRAALPAVADGDRVPPARGRQLPRALRSPATEAAGRTVRTHAAGAQLEQQQRRLQRAAVPPSAPQRPPRQPDPALPGAASFRRGAAAADRLRRHDPAGAGAAAVAPSDGPAPDRPLRRRRDPCEHPPAGPRDACSRATVPPDDDVISRGRPATAARPASGCGPRASCAVARGRR